MKAIVIGAGFSGLSLAALLAKDGFEVTLLEKNELPGGRGTAWREGGFHFDMGPSWYLMPEVFERFFAEFGKDINKEVTLKQLDPAYQVFLGDTRFSVPAGLHAAMKLFDSFEPQGGEKLKRYLDQARYQYRVAVDQFLYKEYRTVLDFFTPRLIREAPRLNLFRSVDSAVRRSFTSDEARKVLEYTMVFLGVDPRAAPAIYTLMSHVDLELGVFYPMGGIYSVVEAMERLCREQRVEIRYNTPVEQIIVERGLAKGVRCDNQRIDADVVISTADYAFTELKLLSEEHRTYSERYWKKRVYAPSGLLVYVGVEKRVPGLEHHNLYFERNWERHFDDIFRNPRWPETPSYYTCCPSITDPSVAPAGKENLFVFVPVAAGLQDSDDTREKMCHQTLSHLEGLLGTQFQSDISVKRIFSHRDFVSSYNAYQGTALGIAHTLLQTAIFRPSHRSKRVKNLFYGGQYTHPGIGVPMCLISSHILRGEVSRIYG